MVTGRVDRLERDAEGRLVVVDLKTGRTKATDVEAHPQLSTYQLAVEHGAFADEGTAAGGGVLVQLGASGALEQSQPALAESDDPERARALLDAYADRMRGAEFTAVENPRCFTCVVRSSCPLQIEGRQVP